MTPFEQVYLQCRSNLLKQATRLVGPQHAEDVVQSAIVKVLERMARKPGGVDPQPSDFVIAVWYTGLNHLRRQRLEQEYVSAAADVHPAVKHDNHDVDAIALYPDTTPSPEQDMEAKAFLAAFHAVKMSPWIWRATFLYYIKGLSMREVSDQLGITIGAVGRALHLARRKLQKGLKKWNTP